MYLYTYLYTCILKFKPVREGKGQGGYVFEKRVEEIERGRL